MNRAYEEIMGRIRLSDEMRQRILEHVLTAEETPSTKVVRVPFGRTYWSAAACFVVLLVGVMASMHLWQMQRPPVALEPVSGIVQADSYEALEQAVGFPVKELSALPFEVTKITYSTYWAELAEVVYSGDEQKAVFRMSPGGDDNSGDFNTYPSVIEVTADGNTVTLKGTGQAYALAVWTDGAYSYSIRLSGGMAEGDWMQILLGIE